MCVAIIIIGKVTNLREEVGVWEELEVGDRGIEVM